MDAIDSALFSTSFGYVFYFYENPASIRKELIGILSELDVVFPEPFYRVKHGSDAYGRSSKPMVKYMSELISSATFRKSQLVSFTNGSKEKTQNQKLEFLGRAIEDWFPKKTPNYIYVESAFPIDRRLKWAFFRNVFTHHSFHIGCAHPVIAVNDENLPRSAIHAVRFLVATEQRIKEFYSTWGNLNYLENATHCLEGPSEFIGGTLLRKKMSFKEIVSAKERCHLDADRECLWLRSDNGAEFGELSSAVSGYVCDYGKPDMFWTNQQWYEWRRRWLNK